jgi:enterochelin esterase-like enzyme
MRRTVVIAVALILVLALGTWLWTMLRPAPNPIVSLVAEIEAGRRSTPVIGPQLPGGGATVTFFAQAVDGRAPRIVSDVTGWGERVDGTFDFTIGAMTRVGKGDWYALSAPVDAGARIEYLIAYAPGDLRQDPHNLRRAAGPLMGGAPASEFVMPNYTVPSEHIVPDEVAAGPVTEAHVASASLGRSCHVFVHAAVGVPVKDAPLVVFVDGRFGQVVRTIDGLVARGQMAPALTVFVAPEVADHGAWTEDQWRTFLQRDLPVWATKHFGATTAAGRRAIAAISYGAKDALFAALGGSAYERLGLLIPGRRIAADDIARVAEFGYPHPRLRVTILAGRYDHANVPTARSLRQALTAAGHQMEYIEVPEGHSAVTWTMHVGEVLASVMR